jgi:hypothetical protein
MADASAVSRPVEPRPLDAIVCVGPGPVGVALAAIEGLRAFTGVARIDVIAAPDSVAPLRHSLHGLPGISIRDERAVALGVDRAAIERHLADRGADPRRAGWYLQQFLKFAAAAEPGTEWRLVWDGDTLPLRPLRLLSDEATPRPLLAPRADRHPPYFQTIERLLGTGPLAPHSFIHEHLLMRRDLAAALLDTLRAEGEPWPLRVLAAIDDDDLVPSGFSEFETYGTFVHWRDPQHFALRPLRSTRDAMIVLGPRPTAANLIALSNRFDLATFEARHRTSRRGRWRARLGIRVAGRMLDAWRVGGSTDRSLHTSALSRMATLMAL